jgi:hypothetical protein
MNYIHEEQMSEAELHRRVEAMSNEAQEHFRVLIHKLVACYSNADAQALVLFSGANDKLGGIVTVNCSEMDALRLVMSANDLFGFMNVADAPPKEHFN